MLPGLAAAQNIAPSQQNVRNLSPLTDLHAVQKLSADELRRGYPVSLEGRVVQTQRNRSLITLQIGESGITVYVTEPNGLTTEGQKVRVEGFTVAKRYVQVLANRLTVLDPTIALPAPRKSTVQEAVEKPPLFCLVEVTGVIAKAIKRSQRYELEVRDREHSFTVHVQQRATTPAPERLIDAKMKFVGVISEAPSDSDEPGVRLLVRDWLDSTMIKEAPVQPFDRRRRSVEAMLKTSRKNFPEFRVRLRGEVMSEPVNGLFRLRDESGEGLVRLAGWRTVKPGQIVDVTGFTERGEEGNFVDRARFRQLGLPRTRLAVDYSPLPGTELGDYTPVLQQIASIRRLSKKRIAALPPALLQGNLMYHDAGTGMLYVQDAGGGIGVIVAAGEEIPPLGRLVEVSGFVSPSTTSPVVRWAKIKDLGDKKVARPLRGTSGALALGKLDGQWISLDGVGRTVETIGNEARLRLARSDRKFRVRISGVGEEALDRFIDAKLILRGVARTLLDSDGQNIGSELLVADPTDIEISEPAPTNAFAMPLSTIDSLKRSRGEGTYTHRNRTVGTVTLAWPNLVQIDDGTNVLRAQVVSPTGLLTGHRAEVAGFPNLGRFGLEFEDAVVKDLGPGEPVEPVRLSAERVLEKGRDGQLAELDGTLIKQVSGATEHLFLLQAGTETFPVVLPTMYATPALRRMQEGSRLRVKGVLQLEAEENTPPHSFRVLLPDADSVSVLQFPSWWTAPRLIAAIGALGGMIAVILFWAAGQRRKSQASETRFARAINSSPIAVVIIGATDGRVLEVNNRFLKLTGLRRENTRALTLANLRVWPDAPVAADLLADSKAGRSRQAVWRGVDGRSVQVLISAEPIEMDSREALLLSAVDVTEKFRLLEQLRDSQKMEAVGKLASGVSHDFNNLLTVIRGNAEMLKEDLDSDSSLAELNDEVAAAAAKASELTGQLLAFSRKQLLCMRAVDVGQLVDGSLRMLRRLLEENIQIDTELPGRCPTINADVSALEQVLMNLAVNARDAMPGGGTLTLKVDLVDVDSAEARLHPDVLAGPFARITVEDTGCGMDAETRERIFEPFFTTKKSSHHTGLGLATVYGIVRQHRGWVDVQSEPGAGSCFTIYLPVYLESEPDEQQTRECPGGSESILVVEDEGQVRRITVSMLRRAGYQITEAENAAEARRHWNDRKDEFDLLLTDILMPGETGLELASDLHAERPDLKIIAITGYSGDAVNQVDIDALGATLFHKPFTRASLTKLVRTILDGKSPRI